ncbi:hypothetical protein ACQKL5_11870 [Peribacillus sp. NPDC097675]|uniref:hypothetical protein n=1 Tax=Peribacillus sp. NPDC097675 TaxID=3390618 RepID=UPI003CFBF742
MGEIPYFFNDPDGFRTNDDGDKNDYKTEGELTRAFSMRNPDLLIQSAKSSQSLMDDAKKVVDMIATSKPFSTRLMAAAQESKTAAVTDMIKKTGVKTVPDIKYNPDGIRFDFYPKSGEVNCHIIINLKWSN